MVDIVRSKTNHCISLSLVGLNKIKGSVYGQIFVGPVQGDVASANIGEYDAIVEGIQNTIDGNTIGNIA